MTKTQLNKKTKMKNTIITASFLLLSTLTYGQTKEETISWLKEKIKNNLIGNYSSKGKLFYSYTIESFTINECELYIKMKEETNQNAYSFFDLRIPIQNLSFYPNGTFYNYDIKLILTKSSYRDGIGEKRILKDTAGYSRIDFSNEENIQERIQKAITHLATFCPEKKKETF